jgi:hypothetical protein
MTVVAPTARGENHCHSEMSKVAAASWDTRSPAVMPSTATLARTWLSMPSWRISAPFGSPVEPDVKMM